MPLFDYRCDAGHVSEALRSAQVSVIPCHCGQSARRQLSAFAFRHGTPAQTTQQRPDIDRGAFRRYEEASQELDRPFVEREQLEGTSIPRPPLARAGKERAQALMRAGVTSIQS